MKVICSRGNLRRAHSRPLGWIWVAAVGLLCAGESLHAQDAAPKEVVLGGYATHQTVDLGGHIVGVYGSKPMYDTLVNLQSGPRILDYDLTLHATDHKHFPLFDSLTTASAGYGGDPNSFTMLKMSKGKLYDFQGMFRRDRQYFDYDLFGNPLIPSGVTSDGYTFPQVLNAPHLFNTVRRMTDVGLTLLPVSRVSLRFGYSQNIMQGPSYSSVHFGTEALLLQNWRESTDTWLAAVDWKPARNTVITYEEHITHYKGNTNWQLAGLNLQLSNGTPVTLGFDNVAVPSCPGGAPIASRSTNPATVNPACNAFLQYERSSPTRTIFPTEIFRFQTAAVENFKVNGNVRYTGANLNMPDYFEYFNGLESRTTLRASTVTGYGRAERIDVNAEVGFVWQISRRFDLSNQYTFDDFRQPATSCLSEVDQDGSSMLNPPGPPLTPSITAGNTFFSQKRHTNSITGAWEASNKASVSLTYRFRNRFIDRDMPFTTDALAHGTAYTLTIHENSGILAAELRPTRRWKLGGSIEQTFADNAYTQLSPRALQRYQARAMYKPRDWATVTVAYNDLERSDNVLYVDHRDHSRSASAGVTLAPNERYSLDLNYAYTDLYTRTGICYTATPAPAGAGPIPPGTGCGSNTLLGNGYYDAPTQYAALGIGWNPTKRFHSAMGYRVNAIDGSSEFLNPRNVPGSLQSQFHTPYVNAGWRFKDGWMWKGDWNYYGYGEDGAVGPTLPRAFHGNVFTLAVHHDF